MDAPTDPIALAVLLALALLACLALLAATLWAGLWLWRKLALSRRALRELQAGYRARLRSAVARERQRQSWTAKEPRPLDWSDDAEPTEPSIHDARTRVLRRSPPKR